MSEKCLLDDQEKIVQKTEYTYDAAGRLTQQAEYFPSGGVLIKTYTKCFTYDALGHFLTASDYRGNAAPSDPQISYEYDSRDRISKVSYEVPGSDIDYVRCIYDSHGWLSQIRVKEGLLEKTLREYTYDSFGRVSGISDKYDPGSLGGMLSRSYSYDALDHITQITFAKGQNQTEQYCYAYDANGDLTSETSSITYPYGGNDRTLQKSLSYTYDAAGRLTSVTGSRQEGGVTTSISRAYTYDAAGNRTQETDGSVTTQYTYNELDQMTLAVRSQGGNTLSGLTFLYDANGNQIRETDSILGTDITYAYDPADQLTQVMRSENNVQTLSQENRYDGEGQRIQKSMRTQSPGNLTQSTRNYHYQNGTVLYTDDGSVTDTFQMLGAGGNTISAVRPGLSDYEWYLYSSDIRGSITSLTDEDGDIAAAYEYDEFGETEELTGADFDNELGYTGQIWDRETGLYYCNARYYDPAYGRFLTQDTYRGEQTDPQTLHLYTYCANDPVNYTDPSGHWVLSVGVEVQTNAFIGLYKGWAFNCDSRGMCNFMVSNGLMMTTTIIPFYLGGYCAIYEQFNSINSLKGYGASIQLSLGIAFVGISGGLIMSTDGTKSSGKIVSVGLGAQLLDFPYFDIRVGYSRPVTEDISIRRLYSWPRGKSKIYKCGGKCKITIKKERNGSQQSGQE